MLRCWDCILSHTHLDMWSVKAQREKKEAVFTVNGQQQASQWALMTFLCSSAPVLQFLSSTSSALRLWTTYLHSEMCLSMVCKVYLKYFFPFPPRSPRVCTRLAVRESGLLDDAWFCSFGEDSIPECHFVCCTLRGLLKFSAGCSTRCLKKNIPQWRWWSARTW